MKRTAAASLLICSLLIFVAITTRAEGPTGTDSAVTFTRDIAPILYNNCVECHRPGEAAPMSLMSYKEVRPWARSIREKVVEGAMPPWFADPQFGHFVNDRRLGPAEISKITAWVEQGAKEGDPKDLPPTPKFPQGWQIGTPDAVISIPEFSVPADGVVEYKYFTVETTFTEDKWVQAAEIRPGDRSVVHHVIVTVQDPSAQGRRNPDGMLVGMAPGMPPLSLPDGHAKLVKAGSKLVFQMHYTPTGTAAKDATSVGLIFSRKPVHKRVITGGAFSRNLVIPAGAPDHKVTSFHEFKDDVHLLSFMPHMHLRGKDFLYKAVLPDGTSKVILSVPRYDFNWQLQYVLKEPLSLPKGSRIECVAHFDNSTRNKFNPDPTKEVRWGQQTWEEMMIGWFDYTLDEQDVAKAGSGN